MCPSPSISIAGVVADVTTAFAGIRYSAAVAVQPMRHASSVAVATTVDFSTDIFVLEARHMKINATAIASHAMVIKQKTSRLISLEGHCLSHDFFEDGLLDSIWGRGERKDGREGVEC